MLRNLKDLENYRIHATDGDMSRDSIKKAPPYDPNSDWDRDQEIELYRHYDRDGYWAGSRLHETQV